MWNSCDTSAPFQNVWLYAIWPLIYDAKYTASRYNFCEKIALCLIQLTLINKDFSIL